MHKIKLAYLANIRFPSERAHVPQIIHMCNSFATEEIDVTLFANTRVVASPEEISSELLLPIKFSIQRIPFATLPKTKLTFFIKEILFALFFLTKGDRKYNLVISRSEIIVFTLGFFIDNKKLIWESHDGRLNFFSKTLLRRGSPVVVTSKGQFDLFKKFSGRILLAPNAIDESFLLPSLNKTASRKRLNINTNRKIVMYIGGLDSWKGVETFFKASEENSDDDFQFVVIGGKHEEVESLKRVYKKVLFLGPKPYTDLRDNQKAADILVIPNTAKNEMSEKFTSPLKLFAHMVSEVPLIVSDIQSIRSVVNERDVTFFKADNAKDLLLKVQEVFESYSEKEKMAERLGVTSRGFTWKNRALSILNFLGYTKSP